ncbi:hypothetical protein SAMN04488581_3622 [Mycolicibacterium neoaurum]|uniref:hypothetical protein n=1 Tax=Mycolicibacterium neoaurum TaxID=1795 RepID=UPI000568D11F|nr:hypothetical protein [Mycolicibacterium neoaurum]SDE22932.1 hypothetical protein SAMN04488581_3622 [Mycolicibacterium neoaurum]
MGDNVLDDMQEDRDKYREIRQRINHCYSVAGTVERPGPPAFLRDPEIDRMTDVMVDSLLGRISPLDADTEAQNLNRETLKFYREGVCRVAGAETIIGDHDGLQYDPSLSMQTTNRLYGLLAFETRFVFPLSREYGWEALADRYLRNYRRCDIAVALGCDEGNADQIVPIKSGEFICIYKSCAACRAWFDDPHREFFRRREFFTDLFDRQ